MSAFNSLNPEIQGHLKQIAKTSGLPLNEDSYERMAAAWIEKQELFDKAMRDNKMEESSCFLKTDDGGALILTYSGSLLNIGPRLEGRRRCEYTSIGLRADVPPAAAQDNSELSADVMSDEPVLFATGPIKSSSAVFKIAVAKEDMPPEQEASLLTQMTQELAEEFVEVNKTVIE